MHELSLVLSLIDQIDRELRRAGETGRVQRVSLAVGRLSGVHADAMQFAFEAVKSGTLVEDAQLQIEQPPARCVCGACGAQTPLEELCFACPICSSPNVAIEGGQELLLQTIEIDA